ncbi:MAG: hypothetical protein ACYCST_16380 [Acidimicrobiales bacterium]
MTREQYLAQLPRNVAAAGAFVTDSEGRVLLVKPTYKQDWEVPGGGVVIEPAALNLKLPGEELSAALFVLIDEIGGFLTERQARRMAAAADARSENRVIEMVNGNSARPVEVAVTFQGLDALDAEPSACGFDHCRDVLLVRGDNDLVTPSDGTFSNGHVDDVVVPGPAGELAHPARLIGAHRLDLAAGEHPSQTGLARATAPGFGDDGSRHGGKDLFGQEADMQCPHAPVVSLSGDERTRVVGCPSHHHADRFGNAGLFVEVRPSSSRARSKPSANSCSVSGPCSDSHSAAPRRPASSLRRREAVSAIHALNVDPAVSAAWSISRARSGGNETDRFSRCATSTW